MHVTFERLELSGHPDNQSPLRMTWYFLCPGGGTAIWDISVEGLNSTLVYLSEQWGKRLENGDC